ncbi:hypothetical protein PPL_12156 [Heterostelium album PN500]|uniref:HD/PDEase domain-containing protein n=1 Tax=Heterostelium pallidum (strain ATCC 26659 / Pp 5 / PN500) TaxID=670386 RepID=D3BLV2_HETP5|nr:hypothetical protein PPL_12156 [Heterostelium album PN500]EFA77553.1 hypothetical protein PPL_12156 [Heterostelium album PN500]|eukprot:XP_020429681.1 hypothetical protein PPL_12156 [Heterostelium album PN500]
MDIISKAKEYVMKDMINNDPSHDWAHVVRVINLVETIAREEKYSGDMEILLLSAILHDVGDWKYSGNENAATNAIEAFLSSNSYPSEKIDRICKIVDDVSFKNELGRPTDYIYSKESKIVQDADRLDAIGATGVARTFAFGATKGSKFYGENSFGREIVTEMKKEEYMGKKGEPTVDHFYDKLFRLKSMMKTETGKRMAEKRHQFMIDFIEQFNLEVRSIN